MTKTKRFGLPVAAILILCGAGNAAGTPPDFLVLGLEAAVGNPSAALTVEGELRAVDPSGEPRLWGRGRPGVFVYPKPISGNYCINFAAGGVEFGLSSVLVPWSGAADACPAGTWVCRIEELIACDTTRASTAYDLGRSCDGSPFSRPVNDELGWTAGAERDDIYLQGGDVFSEQGLPGQVRTCIELPVWCCW